MADWLQHSPFTTNANKMAAIIYNNNMILSLLVVACFLCMSEAFTTPMIHNTHIKFQQPKFYAPSASAKLQILSTRSLLFGGRSCFCWGITSWMFRISFLGGWRFITLVIMFIWHYYLVNNMLYSLLRRCFAKCEFCNGSVKY